MMCKHCSGVFLKRMEHVASPEDLIELAACLSDARGEGFLLTGGSDSRGKVPLEGFADAIATVKETTSLRINAHVGLMPRRELESLVRAGVDAFSVDVYGTDSAIKKTLGLNAGAADFLSVVKDLRDIGAPIVAPHICVGVEEGALIGERAAVQSLVRYAPDVLVIIALMPTRGTPYENITPPSDDSVIDIIRIARAELPDTRLVLGCMRPRGGRTLELAAVEAGVDGIAVPNKDAVRTLTKNGWRIEEKRVCCAIG